MALPLNVQQLLAGKVVEWERLEFKQGWNPEATIHTLCAFANDFHDWGGGYLIIGISEARGRPILPPAGLSASEIDSIQREMIGLGHRLRPAYHPIMEPVEVEGQLVLVVWVPGGDVRPYQAPVSLSDENKDYAFYIRRGSANVRPRGADEQELLAFANRIPFDDRVNTRAAASDLQLPLMQNFLREVRSELLAESARMPFDELCRRMHLLGGPPEALLPLNVGLLFFTSDPTTLFPQTQIDVVVFPKGRGGDDFTEKIFKGPVGSMLRDSLDYLRNRVLVEHVHKRPERAEADRYFNVPFSALEEALVNAVYHRSYEEQHPVEVQVTPEEVTIVSYPGPDRSINLDDLRRGRAVPRRYRNRRIGEFLKELELSEGRGTGIPKILRAMRDNGSPDPLFEIDADRTYFSVLLPIRPAPTPQDATPISIRETGASGLEPGLTPQATPQDHLLEMRELARFCETSRSAAEILRHLKLRDLKNFRINYLRAALSAGWVEMTIPSKPRSPAQRYRITPRGRDWLHRKLP
jgi:ATP-dependent DNA helicase RecG